MKKKIIILIASISVCVVCGVTALIVGLTAGARNNGGDGGIGGNGGNSENNGGGNVVVAPPATYHNNFTVEKSIDGQAKTVSIGDEIKYNIVVSNKSDAKLLVTITDEIPEHTTYVSGGQSKTNSTLSWEICVDGNDSETLTYTVKVNADESLLNHEEIDATTLRAGEKEATCETLYIANTFNNADREAITYGIKTLAYNDRLDGLSVLRQMYHSAFSIAPNITGLPSEILDAVFETTSTEAGLAYRTMTIPTLYGGSEVSEELDVNFKGERELPEEKDLIEGDVIIAEFEESFEVYVFDGENLIALQDGYQEHSVQEVLSKIPSAKRFVAMRPSITLSLAHYGEYFKIDENLTLEQKVLLSTAKAYLNRGFRLQYDDTRMNYPYKASSDRGEFRWQIGQYNPEDYTTQNWGYINCAAFTYEVYRTALGMDLGDLYMTERLTKYYTNGGQIGAPMYPYCYNPNVNADSVERENVRTQFYATLEAGDLIIVRRNNSTGHVLMYLGNNLAINSSGSSCAYDDTETFESSIRYVNTDAYLFDRTTNNYIFRSDGYISQLSIVRPLDIYDGQIPENALNRLENLDNILAEKLSSHPEGKTVNAGDDITFSFHIKNLGNTDKTLTITDVIPANTVFKSASNNASVQDQQNISWTLTVKAGESVVVSYVVEARGETGSVIYGANAKIGGVTFTCPKIFIKNTLTQQQQQAIRNIALGYLQNNTQGLSRLELISEIYKQAGLDDPFASVTEEEIRASFFKETSSGLAYGKNLWELKRDGSCYNMLVDGLYGGRNVFTPQQYTEASKVNTDRSRLPRELSLTIGDVLLAKFSTSETCYIYIGEGQFLNVSTSEIAEDTYNADTRLTRMISARHYYCVLRPSQMMTQD